MILVEGCDGTGKTTLVNQLAQELHLPIGVRGTRDRDKLFEVTRGDTYTALSRAVRGGRRPHIWDRLGPISDPIYSKIMGRKCAFTRAELQFALGILKVMKCPIIFCIVPLEVIQENCLKEHQMDKVEENLPYLAGAYESLSHSIDGAYVYDYRIPGAYTTLLTDVINPYLVRRKDREWQF